MSDMRMPQMNGAQLLARVRELAPDTTRVLLTGQSEIEAAIAAVNEGAIFRFLSKPCPPQLLATALHDAVRQCRLIRAEKQLLEQTLVGTVRLMTEVLELAAPSAFQRASHVRAIVEHLVRAFRLEQSWIYETAAALCQIGCVALPSEIVERALAARPLSPEDQKGYVAHRLLRRIPRLEGVAEIVRRQSARCVSEATDNEQLALGGELLHLALELDKLLARGSTASQAVAELRKRPPAVRPALLEALRTFAGLCEREVTRVVYVRELSPAMTFDEEVRTRAGALVVGKGRRADLITIERLRRFAEGAGLVEPFRVRVAVTV